MIPARNPYELVHHLSNMLDLSKQFKLVMLLNPEPKSFRKFVNLEVASFHQPNHILHCGTCLYKLGFGYDRIIRYVGLKPKNKEKLACWIQRRKKHAGLVKPIKIPYVKRPRVRSPERNRGPRKSTYIPIDPEIRLQRSLASKTQLKAKARLRSYFSQWMNSGLYPKLMTTVVGCDLHFIHHWLSSQFKKDMTWDNHGTCWQIDHIIPCKAFDLTKREDVLKCFHFSNMRPLHSKVNMQKSDKIVDCQPELAMGYGKYKLPKRRGLKEAVG